MESERRQKRIASVIKEALGGLILQEFRDTAPAVLITITRIEMTQDLRTARVFLSFFGAADSKPFLYLLEQRKGHLRKILASRVKLKYNPSLIFAADSSAAVEQRIDQLIDMTKKR